MKSFPAHSTRHRTSKNSLRRRIHETPDRFRIEPYLRHVALRGERKLAVRLEVHYCPARKVQFLFSVSEINDTFGQAPVFEPHQDGSFAAKRLSCFRRHLSQDRMIECGAYRHDCRLDFIFGRADKPAARCGGLLNSIPTSEINGREQRMDKRTEAPAARSLRAAARYRFHTHVWRRWCYDALSVPAFPAGEFGDGLHLQCWLRGPRKQLLARSFP